MDYEKIRRLVEFDSPTVANGLELLEVQDPTVGYTGPDVRALMPELGPRVGIAVTARMDSTTAGDRKSRELVQRLAARHPAGGAECRGRGAAGLCRHGIGWSPGHAIPSRLVMGWARG